MARVRQLQISAIQATADPTVNDDTTTGVLIGHLWANTTSKNVFVCEDNSTGSAVWVEVTANEGYVAPPITPTTTGTRGQWSYSSGYLYKCVATNTWVRHVIATTW